MGSTNIAYYPEHGISLEMMAPHIVHNQSPAACLMNMTPFGAFFGKKPDLMMLSEFGKAMLVWVPDMEHRKLDARPIKCQLLSVDKVSKAWHVLDECVHKVHISCDCVFPADYTMLPNEDEDADCRLRRRGIH